MIKKSWLIAISCLLFMNQLASTTPTADISLIVYSYDRPLQLYTFLHSLQQHTTGLREIMVIYRFSDREFQAGYEQLWQTKLIQQSPVPIKLMPQVAKFDQAKKRYKAPTDFRDLTFKALNLAPEYIVFAVDDNIVVGTIDFQTCVQVLTATSAHSFSLRLGKNIQGSAVSGEQNGLPQFYAYRQPKFIQLPNLPAEILAWYLKQADRDSDWHYSCTVDMNIYRTQNVLSELASLNPTRFTSPRFEGDWEAQQRPKLQEQLFLCFTTSKVINTPLNKVRPESTCYAQNISTKQLLQLFKQHYCIDLKPLTQLKINSPHLAYEPTFVKFAA